MKLRRRYVWVFGLILGAIWLIVMIKGKEKEVLGPAPAGSRSQAKQPYKSTFIKRRPKISTKVSIGTTEAGSKYVANELLMGFKVGTKQEAILGWLKEHGLRLAKYYPSTGIVHAVITQSAASQDALEMIEILKDTLHPSIEYIEPNYLLKTD